jgi:hypothetical protein
MNISFNLYNLYIEMDNYNDVCNLLANKLKIQENQPISNTIESFLNPRVIGMEECLKLIEETNGNCSIMFYPNELKKLIPFSDFVYNEVITNNTFYPNLSNFKSSLIYHPYTIEKCWISHPIILDKYEYGEKFENIYLYLLIGKDKLDGNICINQYSFGFNSYCECIKNSLANVNIFCDSRFPIPPKKYILDWTPVQFVDLGAM